MAARYQSIAVPAAELGFAIAMFACGLFDAPMWLTGLICYAMLLHWGWTRRRILNRLRGVTWATQTGLAICVLIAILVGAYWLGMQTRAL